MEDLETIARRWSELRRRVRDEDAVQEAFVRLAARGAGGLVNPEGWWCVAAHRVRIDGHRREAAGERAKWALYHEARRDTGPEPEPGPDPRLPELHDAVRRLAPGQRALVELELAGVTRVADLATRLGTTPGAVKVRRHRAHHRLRRLMEEGAGRPPPSLQLSGEDERVEARPTGSQLAPLGRVEVEDRQRGGRELQVQLTHRLVVAVTGELDGEVLQPGVVGDHHDRRRRPVDPTEAIEQLAG